MQDLIATWQSTTFVDAASEWVDEVLAQRGVQCTGELEPHKVRFWAAVFSAQTTAGRVWLKVANPGQGFEGALLQSLGWLRPGEVMTPMAVNVERGWWLLPDGGPTLREIANSEAVWFACYVRWRGHKRLWRTRGCRWRWSLGCRLETLHRTSPH